MPKSATESLQDNWMGGYASPSSEYDEYLDATGAPRAHWEKVAEQIGSLDKAAWQRREKQLARLIHDHGITYNVYGEEGGNARPWSMDMVPLVISQSEMSTIESALSQRVHLLNLILQDVYGRQTMLQSSKMHPYLVFANPSFLRPCHGLIPPRGKHIQVYAADLARAPNGKWWVLSDRVEAASGLGYALENRMLASRIFPKLIAESDARSLQPFVKALCRHIESEAAGDTDSPNIALLTAGPSNETYFEQSFLARNLGYSLVEGEDLTVRADRLLMKTINGVQPVHGLMRRIDSSYVDPLELQNESLLGVPGLVNAVRRQNVTLFNGLGSSFVETPALPAFLPWFCRNYLGENLEMPSVATWWCGQQKECDYVLENLESLIVKPTFRTASSQTYFGPQMSVAERDTLARRIREFPERYCGQEVVSQATTPVYENGSLHARPFLLRVFLVPTADGWQMMPGGLARYASADNTLSVSMQQGGQSKDTWVVNDAEPQPRPQSITLATKPQTIRRNVADLPSRTADNLYWLGRYMERAESLARILRSLITFMTDDAGDEEQSAALPFLDQILPPSEDLDTLADPETGRLIPSLVEPLLLRSLSDLNNPESLQSTFQSIGRAASKVKERLSADTWKRIQNFIDLGSRKLPADLYDSEILPYIDEALDNLSIFVGNVYENMTRSHGWRFLQIGRRLERALSTSALLQSSFATSALPSEALLAQLLDWADSTITYRRRYLNAQESRTTLELLCFDEVNPRSLIHQATSLRELLSALPHTQSPSSTPNLIDTNALQLYSRIGLHNSKTLIEDDDEARRAAIDTFFSQTYATLLQLANAIQGQYFAHTKSADAQRQESFVG